MKKAPAGGFAKGATCGSSGQAFEDETDLTMSDSVLDSDVESTIAEALADGADPMDVNEAGESHADHPSHVDGAEAAPVAEDPCGRCFETICENDSYCCETEWDDRCVQTGLTICEAMCGAEATQPL